MKKPNGLLTVGVVVCLLISSCNNDNPAGTSSGSSGIRPLAIGNYWIYDIDTSTIIHSIFYCDTMRVVSYDNLNGNSAYGIDYNNSFVLYFNNMSGGQYYFAKTLHDTTYEYTPKLYIKYPIAVNDKITGPFDAKFKCVSLSAAFNNFSGCIDLIPVIEYQGDLTNYHEYWRAGIGLIGTEYDYKGKHYRNRLVDYRVQ
ncbi:MAG: hypothetical protein WCK13_07045 [Ignavibacteriota bacterium]